MDFLNFSSHKMKKNFVRGMLPDFQGLSILNSFLLSVLVDSLKDEEGAVKISEKSSHLYRPSENNLSCKTCHIPSFCTLEEFKQHRQSQEHLNNLTGNLTLISQANANDSSSNHEFTNISQGSPYFEIIYSNVIKLKCYKTLLVNRKIYSKSSINLTLSLYNNLKNFQNGFIMIALNGGGYFAAAIFDNSVKKIVCSKTFKRYTCRRKQGGSQSLKDNQKSGKIHSAGSLIRRENEKKLQDEISNLVLTWKPYMDKCFSVFCNRDPFLTHEVFKDITIKALPFTTYQADYEEICRFYTELISSIR